MGCGASSSGDAARAPDNTAQATSDSQAPKDTIPAVKTREDAAQEPQGTGGAGEATASAAAQDESAQGGLVWEKDDSSGAMEHTMAVREPSMAAPMHQRPPDGDEPLILDSAGFHAAGSIMPSGSHAIAADGVDPSALPRVMSLPPAPADGDEFDYNATFEARAAPKRAQPAGARASGAAAGPGAEVLALDGPGAGEAVETAPDPWAQLQADYGARPAYPDSMHSSRPGSYSRAAQRDEILLLDDGTEHSPSAAPLAQQQQSGRTAAPALPVPHREGPRNGEWGVGELAEAGALMLGDDLLDPASSGSAGMRADSLARDAAWPADQQGQPQVEAHCPVVDDIAVEDIEDDAALQAELDRLNCDLDNELASKLEALEAMQEEEDEG